MPRRRSREVKSLPPLLVRLIEAAKYAGEDAEGGDLSGAPDALREFGELALWAVPIHGVFVPNNRDISLIVERVAKAHLGLEEARRECRKTLKVVEAFPQLRRHRVRLQPRAERLRRGVLLRRPGVRYRARESCRYSIGRSPDGVSR